MPMPDFPDMVKDFPVRAAWRGRAWPAPAAGAGAAGVQAARVTSGNCERGKLTGNDRLSACATPLREAPLREEPR